MSVIDQAPVRRNLPAEMATLLAEGQHDRSRAIWRVMWSMIQCEWTEQESLAILLLPENAAGAKFQEQYRRNTVSATRSFQRQWDKASRLIGDKEGVDLFDLAASLAQIEDWADEHGHFFSGQRARDRLGLGVLCEVALQSKSRTFGVSSRRLSVLLNVRAQTAVVVLQRLTKTPLLTLVDPARGTKAARYRLTHPDGLLCPVCRTAPVVVSPTGVRTTAAVLHTRATEVHDTFLTPTPTRRSLGAQAALMWNSLTDQPVSEADLVAHSQRHRTTVKRTLLRLHSAGLAEETTLGWVRTSIEPEQVARALGVPDVKAQRERAYVKERESFQAWQERKDRATSGERARVARWHKANKKVAGVPHAVSPQSSGRVVPQGRPASGSG